MQPITTDGEHVLHSLGLTVILKLNHCLVPT